MGALLYPHGQATAQQAVGNPDSVQECSALHIRDQGQGSGTQHPYHPPSAGGKYTTTTTGEKAGAGSRRRRTAQGRRDKKGRGAWRAWAGEKGLIGEVVEK